MPDDSDHSLPSPWKEFLAELDALLTEPVELHCIGGFVVCFFYELPRSKGDIDYYKAIPVDVNLIDVAGEGSDLAKKHKVWLHRVGASNLPEDYETRLARMFPGQFKNLTLLAPDPYDFMLSKLERNTTKDRDDAEYLFKTLELNSKILRERYEKELRPYLANEDRHDSTLELWIEIFES